MRFVQRLLHEASKTLRFRLTLWITLVVTLMVVVTMLTVREVVLRRLQDEFDELLKSEASDISLQLKQHYPERLDQIKKDLEQKTLLHALQQWFVEIDDAEGQLIWASPNVPKLPKLQPLQTLRLYNVDDSRVIEARHTIKSASRPDDYLISRSGRSRASLEEDIDLLNHTMILSSTLIVLLAPLGGYIMAGRATRPISWIISTAARLQPANLNERLPIRGTGDELDQLSQTINGMLDRIASYLDRNREFVANAAHELRSPLAAIRSSVEVALNRSRTTEEYVTLLAEVMEECSRLSNLVNRLLLLAEGDAGRLGFREQTARLDKIVRESVDMFEAVAESEGVHLRVGTLPSVSVPGDEFHLRQVVRNLLDNAIKFTPKMKHVDVALMTDPSHKLVHLTVRDEGIGIPAEYLPNIFDRFYRIDKARNRFSKGGNGLGLSICRTIVTALGGEIEVQSHEGQGSVFTVHLPIQEEKP